MKVKNNIYYNLLTLQSFKNTICFSKKRNKYKGGLPKKIEIVLFLKKK